MTTYDRSIADKKLPPFPDSSITMRTIDMHTEGEPLRVIIDGYPPLPGDSVLAHRTYCATHLDHLRKALMWEPRGHADMYGCLLTPPNDPSGDFGIVFMHNDGYSTMCGHAIIAITKLAVLMGWKEMNSGPVKLLIDVPCGRITSHVRMEGNEVAEVSFEGVPSFRVGKGFTITLQDFGTINYELAYGGAFYAYVDSGQLNLDLSPQNLPEIINMGRRIKKEVIRTQASIRHPFEPDLSFLYGTIFTGPAKESGLHSRNVCVFADGQVDRCPTGSGLSGRLPIHYSAGQIGLNEEIRVESILGTTFSGSVVGEVQYGPYQAVIPRITGNAYITGEHQFVIDPKDPLPEGFLLR